MAYQCCRDLKLGGQNHLPMLKMLKVSSRSHGGHQRSNCLPLLYVHETWWMESSLHANNSEGQVRSPGVTQGQIWLTIVVWTWNLVDGVIFGCQTLLRSPWVTQGHALPLLYEHKTWWVESSWDANNSESHAKVTCFIKDVQGLHSLNLPSYRKFNCNGPGPTISLHSKTLKFNRLTYFVPSKGHSLIF